MHNPKRDTKIDLGTQMPMVSKGTLETWQNSEKHSDQLISHRKIIRVSFFIYFY